MVTEDGSTGSEKVADTVEVVGIPAAPSAGDMETTRGGVLSISVVLSASSPSQPAATASAIPNP